MKAIHIISVIIIATLLACNGSSTDQTQADRSTEAFTSNVTSNNTNMKGFKINIEQATLANDNYRKVLYTGPHMQLVLMTLKPNEEIGMEVHENSDQFFRFESGKGKCIVNGTEYVVGDGDVVLVPAGASHNVMNTDASKDLKLYTIYAEPTHKDGLVAATKEEADKNELKFDGKTTE